MVGAAATGAAATGAGESGPDGDGAAAAHAEGDVAGGGTFHLLGALSTNGFTYSLAELADELNKRSNGIIPLLSGDDVESAINQATAGRRYVTSWLLERGINRFASAASWQTHTQGWQTRALTAVL